jgi:hypothetical protein
MLAGRGDATAGGAAEATRSSGLQPWRRLDLRLLFPPRRADPFLVLDVGEFTARCRACHWISPPSATVAEARAWFAGHACEQTPAWPPLLRLRLAAAELAAVGLRRCLVCARIGLRRFRPARLEMPLGWVRTWVCTERPSCRERWAALEVRRQRGWRRRRLA